MIPEIFPIPSYDPLHFVTEKAALLKALTHCQGVVERRNTVPILAHIHIEAQGKKVKITATDLEIACIETLSANVQTSGRTTVSAQLLFDVENEVKPEKTQDESFLVAAKNGVSIVTHVSEKRTKDYHVTGYHFTRTTTKKNLLVTLESSTSRPIVPPATLQIFTPDRIRQDRLESDEFTLNDDNSLTLKFNLSGIKQGTYQGLILLSEGDDVSYGDLINLEVPD